MESPKGKALPSATKKKSTLPTKPAGKKLGSESPLPGKGASDTKIPELDNPINKPSPPRGLKKNIPKLPKKDRSKELSPETQEKKESQTDLPAIAKPEGADELNPDLEHEEPIPIEETVEETVEEHAEPLELLEESEEETESPSQEQRKAKSKEREASSASGSGAGSMFQRGKNAASRFSDFTDTVRGFTNRTTAALPDGTLENAQEKARGTAEKFQSYGGRAASKVAGKVSDYMTQLSDLKGLEVTGEKDILDDDGNAIGTIVEGDPSELTGHVIGDEGEILDEDGDLIGRVELISEETVKQADAVEEVADTNHIPSLQELSDLPIANDGTVKDSAGRVLGRLVEGDAEDLVGQTVNENGEVLDEDGDLVGRVEPFSLDQVEEEAGKADPTGGVLLPTAILRGREVNEDGKILNDEGDFLGQVAEGYDPRHLSGKVPNEHGQVIDLTGEVIGQVETVPGEAADAAMQELEHKAAVAKKDGLEKDESGQDTTEANELEDLSLELPDISTLEGLKCNKFGNIVGEDGVPVGELIEGNPKELSKGGYELDDCGQFWDNRGNVLGKAKPIAVEEEDQRPFADFEDLVVVEDGWVEDSDGARVGQVVEGEIKKLVGRAVDDDGDILDKRGNLIGHAEPWEEPEPEPEEVDLSMLEGLSPNKLGLVMGPDGVPIGRVVDGDLKKLIRRTIDDQGQLWSDDGKIIGRVEPIPEDEREVPMPFSDMGDLVVKQNGFVENELGEVVGKLIDGDPKELQGKAVDDDGDIMDKRGNVIGRAEPYTPSEESEEPEEPEEDLSELEGMLVNKFGNVVDENGAVFGRLVSGNPRKLNGMKVDGEGQIWGDNGKVLGNAELIPAAERERPEGIFYGLDGLAVRKDGSVTNAAEDVVGRLIEGDPARLAGRAVDEDGEIVDKVGNVIGRAERWTPDEKQRDINPMSGRKVNRDGEIRDEDGNLMGRVTMGNVKALIGKVVDDNGNIVDNEGNKIGECTLEENMPESEEVEEVEEPEMSPEEAERKAKEEHDRDLAKKISGVLQQTLDSVEPLCKQITEHLERADRTPRDELDEEKLVQIVKPLIEDAGNMLQECKSTVRALDPDGSIAASAKVHSSTHEATPEEYQLADLLKQLTQTVTTTIENGRRRIADMPHAKKKLNPLWALLSEPLFQIIAAVGLLLSGILGLVNKLLSGLGLGGILQGLLGSLGIDNLMSSLGLGSKGN
ncbi:uncharacterized protein N7506_010158 [Penicillium brevicompactum]|uniref:uncharacterized protein n=1 Tax=Penicillium brevicompactum TaxID=5074 RepID=UPI002541CA54|nr:uncharacterized protein N7506_010158 [Penicillium brevicompactum]KAJ5327056.1 hypothetical protein N7506_010158 [Penicillium brevicompactum]